VIVAVLVAGSVGFGLGIVLGMRRRSPSIFRLGYGLGGVVGLAVGMGGGMKLGRGLGRSYRDGTAKRYGPNPGAVLGKGGDNGKG
jgi:hypothetical protein